MTILEKNIITTNDGSHSISIPGMNVTYHSIHGAIQESMHVFIDAGLKQLDPLRDEYGQERSDKSPRQISILEVGFGTGLNVLLTAIEAELTETFIYYVALEPLPIDESLARSLNYSESLNRIDLKEDFLRMHECPWDKSIAVTEQLLLHKSSARVQEFEHKTKFNLIYFDAFAPNAQPELWTREIFEKLYGLLIPGGLLVTYCSKGDVRRAMQSAGFKVEKLPGPPHKREMLRASKQK